MSERHAFVTGYPGFIARRLVKKLLAADDRLKITVLAEATKRDQAESQISRLGGLSMNPNLPSRVSLVVGDVTAMDVGLSGPEFRRLTSDVTEVYHLAAVHHLGVERAVAERINVEGTRTVLELARAMKRLERFVHFSSAYVAGDRRGVVMEDELELGQAFRNPYEATKHAAEVLVQAQVDRMPITVIRPSAVVGDSRSGEIDRFEGVYYVALLLLASPSNLPIPMPGDGAAPFNIIPVDYLVDAVHAIVGSAATLGKTFHVVDPNPLSSRRVYEAIAKTAGRKPPTIRVSANLTKALLRVPGLERVAPMSHQVIDYLNHMAFFNAANTAETLEGTGICCPRFDAYVANLVRYVREYFESARAVAN